MVPPDLYDLIRIHVETNTPYTWDFRRSKPIPLAEVWDWTEKWLIATIRFFDTSIKIKACHFCSHRKTMREGAEIRINFYEPDSFDKLDKVLEVSKHATKRFKVCDQLVG